MSAEHQPCDDWKLRFDGTAAISPLPKVVLFPHALLPLNIFEPRYRHMTADSLSGNRLIAMGNIRTETKSGFSIERPQIHAIVGLGEIIAHTQLPDGRYHLVLRGVARAMVMYEESNSDLPYRVGQLKILEDDLTGLPVCQATMADRLMSKFCSKSGDPSLQQTIQSSFGRNLPLATVCDIIAAALPLASECAQHLLEQISVVERAATVEALLDGMGGGSTASSEATDCKKLIFPPSFSSN